MFSRAKQGLLVINRQAKNGSDQEKKVAKNVVSSLAIMYINCIIYILCNYYINIYYVL